jgi:hypothetical protein
MKYELILIILIVLLLYFVTKQQKEKFKPYKSSIIFNNNTVDIPSEPLFETKEKQHIDIDDIDDIDYERVDGTNFEKGKEYTGNTLAKLLYGKDEPDSAHTFTFTNINAVVREELPDVKPLYVNKPEDLICKQDVINYANRNKIVSNDLKKRSIRSLKNKGVVNPSTIQIVDEMKLLGETNEMLMHKYQKHSSYGLDFKYPKLF